MKRVARILVVDDKESFRFLMRCYLEEAGYQVTDARSGTEALAELERAHYDLVLSDLVMSEMDGVALLRSVRSTRPRLPFVLVTSHGTVEDAVAAMKEGADHYLRKPVNRNELLLVVQQMLESSRVRGSCDRITLNFEFQQEEFSFDAVTRQLLKWALQRCGNNKSSAARMLKTSRKLFY